MACIQAVQCYQNVGGDFGKSWLEQHGTKPVSIVEAQNNLWNWGSTPKGYTIYNNTLYPPGYGPKWFYPAILTSSAPVVVNSTEANNYLSQSLLPDARTQILGFWPKCWDGQSHTSMYLAVLYSKCSIFLSINTFTDLLYAHSTSQGMG